MTETDTANGDMIKLYSGRILELATDIPHLGRLDAPDGSARRRSPLCGSTLTVDLKVKDNKIIAFAQDVKACALGQAAASVVGANIIGRSRDEVETARDQLRDMLKSGGPAPSAPFDELKVLMPARDYKNRHASIMLALETTLDALDACENRSCA